MYKNIGKKIKTWAKVVCILGIVGSCLMGLILIAAGLISVNAVSRYDGAAASTTMIVTVIGGVLIAGLGSLLSWLSTFLLYGFGQQVDMQEQSANSLEEIRMMLRSYAFSQPPVKAAPVVPPAPVPQPAPIVPPAPVEPVPVEPAEPVCPQCGTKLGADSAFCPNCGCKI